MVKVEFTGLADLLRMSVKTFRSGGPDRVLLLGLRYLSWQLQFHRRVAELPRPIAKTITIIIIFSLTIVIRCFHRIWPHKYTDADPYKRLWVDTEEIHYTTGIPLSKRRGWVQDGEWDKRGNPFLSRPYPKAIEQRYHEDCPWEETALAEKYGGEQFDRHRDRIERLYEYIRRDGYRSQKQLIEDSPEAAWNGLNDAMHPLANEIAVDIGRNGELLWNMCGQHRLAVAKVLDVDKVCVQVFRRHAEWQQVRDRARETGDVPVELYNHPDLQDVIEPK